MAESTQRRFEWPLLELKLVKGCAGSSPAGFAADRQTHLVGWGRAGCRSPWE